jgi:hypothetical protein
MLPYSYTESSNLSLPGPDKNILVLANSLFIFHGYDCVRNR